MSLYVIADLHLGKSAARFKGWERHKERLTENWNSIVANDDTVVIAGDISWAGRIEEAVPDLRFIDEKLKGNKIILKGNHDFWWSTAKKRGELNLKSISFLQDKVYIAADCAFLHHPPIYGSYEDYEIIDMLQKNGVKRCYYGHLHGSAHRCAVQGTHYGMEFFLISADFVDFKPVLTEKY